MNWNVLTPRLGRLLAGEQLAAGELAKLHQTLIARLPFDESLAGDTRQFRAASALARLQLATARSATQNSNRSRLQEAVRWSRWLARNRRSPRDAQLLAVAREALASHVEANGSTDEAIVAWSNLIQDLTESTDKAFAAERLQRSAQARMRRAALLSTQGRSAESVKEYETAIEELNRAWQSSDPDDFYRSHLAEAEFDLGRLLRQSGQRSDAARVYLERSLQTYLELMRQEPSVNVLRRTTQAHKLLGEIRSAPAERIAALERASIGFAMLHDHDTLSGEEMLQWLQVLIKLGELQLQQGH